MDLRRERRIHGRLNPHQRLQAVRAFAALALHRQLGLAERGVDEQIRGNGAQLPRQEYHAEGGIALGRHLPGAQEAAVERRTWPRHGVQLERSVGVLIEQRHRLGTRLAHGPRSKV